jgi:hypothetical protein
MNEEECGGWVYVSKGFTTSVYRVQVEGIGGVASGMKLGFNRGARSVRVVSQNQEC